MNSLLILFCLVVVSPYQLFSQIKEGNFLVGGGFTGKVESIDSKSNSYTSKTEGNVTEFIVFPNIGYFILDNIAFGLTTRLGISDYETESYSENEKIWKTTSSIFTYGIGPIFRYYYPIGDFALVGEFRYEWVKDDGEGEVIDYGFPGNNEKAEENRTLTVLSPAIGLTYFLTRSVSIEGMFKYEIENLDFSRKYESSLSQHELELETKLKRFLFVVGLQVYL